MRKERKQQKSKTSQQMELFDRLKGKPSDKSIDGIEKDNPEGAELSSILEEKRALTENILERIVDYGNLKRALAQVSSNKGSGGVDGMDIEGLQKWFGKNLNNLRKAILTETYEVSPVLKVEIPKSSGGTRILGIPTVKDRLIQQAIHQELSLYYEPYFSESSFGFRPGRSAHQAIEQASYYIMEGKEWVVDIDLEKFFDKINHDRLMQRLSKAIGDKRLLRLINAYLKAGMMREGLTEQRLAGTPQGSPLSPLLSNIVLDELDKEIEKRGHSFCRYADDCNIYVRSQKAGQRVMEKMIRFIEKKMKLKVNRSKSGVRHCSEAKFLGYTLLSEDGIRIADKSIDRFKDKIKEVTCRSRGRNFEAVIEEVNAIIIGWGNYFCLANKWLSELRHLDGWIRRRLRCYRLKQCGRHYTIYKYLRTLGIPESKSWNVVMYSQGWWKMSNKVAVKQKMNPEWFARKGLQSLYLRITV